MVASYVGSHYQDGVLKKRVTYEIIRPQDVGFKGSKIVLGKLSGRHAFSDRLKKLGFSLSDKEIDGAFKRFKTLADKKQKIFDEDIASIVEEGLDAAEEKYKLIDFEVTSGNKTKPVAKVKISHLGKTIEAKSGGDGPIDACFKAIEKAAKEKYKLVDYKVGAVTSGKDALGEASVKLVSGGKIVIGRGTSTDVIESSIRAYINAINRAS